MESRYPELIKCDPYEKCEVDCEWGNNCPVDKMRDDMLVLSKVIKCPVEAWWDCKFYCPFGDHCNVEVPTDKGV
jgi:hypothetical protein